MNEDRLWAVDLELAAAFRHVSDLFHGQFPGSTLSVAQGFRTPEQQSTANSNGASPFNGATSWSKHQAFPALALDFAVIEGGKYVADGRDPRYTWAGKQFEAAGFIWGGRWKKPDFDHVEVGGLGLRSADQAATALAEYQTAFAAREA